MSILTSVHGEKTPLDQDKKIVYIRKESYGNAVFLEDTEGATMYSVDQFRLDELHAIPSGEMDAVQNKIAEIMLASRKLENDEAIAVMMKESKLRRLHKKHGDLCHSLLDPNMTEHEIKLVGQQIRETEEEILETNNIIY